MVRDLKFEGNASIDKTTLAAAIGTTKSSWFATAWPVRWIGLGAKRYLDETDRAQCRAWRETQTAQGRR